MQSLPLDEVLSFFQSNEKLPQQGTVCVLIEGSVGSIPDVTEQYQRIQGIDVAVISMGTEGSFRSLQRHSAIMAGLFDCMSSLSFLTVEHFNTSDSALPARVLTKLPQKFNQWFLPKVVLRQQKYNDRQRRSANKALLVYEQETDDLLAFSE